MSIKKLISFIQRDLDNTKKLCAIFVAHEMAREEGSASSEGLLIEKLISKFPDLGVGLTVAEAKAFHKYFDTNNDGMLSFSEFGDVLASFPKSTVSK